jgi:hypothetical protein
MRDIMETIVLKDRVVDEHYEQCDDEDEYYVCGVSFNIVRIDEDGRELSTVPFSVVRLSANSREMARRLFSGKPINFRDDPAIYLDVCWGLIGCLARVVYFDDVPLEVPKIGADIIRIWDGVIAPILPAGGSLVAGVAAGALVHVRRGLADCIVAIIEHSCGHALRHVTNALELLFGHKHFELEIPLPLGTPVNRVGMLPIMGAYWTTDIFRLKNATVYHWFSSDRLKREFLEFLKTNCQDRPSLVAKLICNLMFSFELQGEHVDKSEDSWIQLIDFCCGILQACCNENSLRHSSILRWIIIGVDENSNIMTSMDENIHYIRLLTQLIDTFGLDIHVNDDEAIVEAINRDHFNAVELLVQKGADLSVLPSMTFNAMSQLRMLKYFSRIIILHDLLRSDDSIEEKRYADFYRCDDCVEAANKTGCSIAGVKQALAVSQAGRGTRI